MARIHTADEAAFSGRLATGMELGAVRGTGNLRMVLTLPPPHGQVAVELPHAWLHNEGGVRHFIKENCQP